MTLTEFRQSFQSFRSAESLALRSPQPALLLRSVPKERARSFESTDADGSALLEPIDLDPVVAWLVKTRRNPIVGGVLVGRGPSCDVVVGYATVSSAHAVFMSEGSRWCVIDHHSSNGTFVNRTRLESGRSHELTDGDEVGLGRRVLGHFLVPTSLWEVCRTGRLPGAA